MIRIEGVAFHMKADGTVQTHAIKYSYIYNLITWP